MKKSSFTVGFAAITALMLPFGLYTQDEEEAPAPLADVWVIVVKPGMDAEFAEAMTAHLKFRADAGESRQWNGYRVVVGHSSGLLL